MLTKDDDGPLLAFNAEASLSSKDCIAGLVGEYLEVVEFGNVS
jgi:hypothetical protein